mgnify:FL=1
MKTFSTVFIFLLFTLTSYLNSSEIKQTTFAYWDKPDVKIFYLTPKKIDINTQILFVIHGNNRNAEDYISAWIPFIENKNIILVAPKFDKKNFRYFFLLESATSSGEINKNSDEYINKSISLFFNFFKSKYSLDTNKYKMFGHSAGAQFTHRYMLLSDDRRISNAVIANAGWYTFLNGENFPYGIKNTPIDISNDHIKWFMSNKASLLIGNNDTKLNNVNSSKGAMRQGITRVDRANTYFKSLVNIADTNNIPFRWSFKVIDGVSHDYTKMTTEAAKILLQDINFIN